MIDPELRRFIVEEIRRQTGVILSGSAGTTSEDAQSEDIQNLYPGFPTLTARPVMHPYGIASRAPQSTIAVTARQGDNPGNRLVLGHRDKERPACLEGEWIAYNVARKQLMLLLDRINIGGPDSAENLVLGQQLKAFLTALDAAVQAIAAATAGIGGSVATLAPFVATIPGLSPTDILTIVAAGTSAGADAGSAGSAGSDVAAADANFVANDAILSDESFTRKGG